MTADPLAFLHAAHAVAQKAAEAAAEVCSCHTPVPSWTFGDETTKGRILIVGDPHPTVHRKMGRRWNGSYEGIFTAEHIVLHDPDAVLRRIAAERKLIGAYEQAASEYEADGSAWDHDSTVGRARTQAILDAVRLTAEGWGWTPQAGETRPIT